MTLAEAMPTSGAVTAPEPVLRVEGLCVSARTEQGLKPLVQDLSFELRKGETLAIAGESGSGKSITSLAIMGLLPQPAVRVTGGRIRFGGQNLTALSEPALRSVRGDRIAMIFQEPMTSLNPVMTIGAQLSEAIRAQSLRLKDVPDEQFDGFVDSINDGRFRAQAEQIVAAKKLAATPLNIDLSAFTAPAAEAAE